jgi:S-adenosylmethionine synthetase
MQHDPGITEGVLRDYFMKKILPRIGAECNDCWRYFDNDYQLLVNPTGRFVIGGPQGDTGLTGRKIIVDTYGGRCPHGGGAFSGKDCTKVDRSAAYGARFAAKLLVAAGAAKEITIQLSYAIGIAKPLSIYVDARGGRYHFSNEVIAKYIAEYLPVTPQQFFDKFGLDRPIFSKTATYGHFGNPDYPWEKISGEFNAIVQLTKIAAEMEKNS